MKPVNFQYLSPDSLSEVLELLERYGEDAKVLSGGQSLIPLLNMRLSTPKYIIDLKKLSELSYIEEKDDRLHIGAMTRHREVEKSDLIKERCGLLNEAIRHVGHPQIRTRGTVGGSIAHADPSAELPCVLSALRGEIVIASSEGERVVRPEEFFLTYMLTSLESTEIVKEVRFPILKSSSGYAFIEMTRRHGDFALVEVAAVIDIEKSGRISLARLAVGGAGPVPCVLEDIEAMLIQQVPNSQLIEEVGEKVKDYLEPESDLHASAEYRVHLASVLTKRALRTAIRRAENGVSL